MNRIAYSQAGVLMVVLGSILFVLGVAVLFGPGGAMIAAGAPMAWFGWRIA